MNKKWFVLLVLIFITGACGLPGIPEEKWISPGEDCTTIYRAQIQGVTVSPQAGKGPFNITVNYKYTTQSKCSGLNAIAGYIHCYYVAPDGASIGIGDKPMTGVKKGGEIVFEGTVEREFSVKEEGDYTATCSNDDASSQKSVPFKVVAEKPAVQENLAHAQIDSVSVAPGSGSGSFTISVKYRYKIDGMNLPESQIITGEVVCRYVTPGGATVLIGNPMTPDSGARFGGVSTKSFSVKEDGDYTATCLNDDASSQKSAQFTKKPEIKTLVGKIEFDYAKSDSSRVDAGPEVRGVTTPCVLDITIEVDGTIKSERECKNVTSYRNLSGGATTKVVVTGDAVRGGKIAFTYDVKETKPNGYEPLPPGSYWVDATVTGYEYIQHVIYTGEGTFTSPTQAEGKATFKYSCTSGASNLLWCFHDWNETFEGTLPWKFTLKE